MQLGRAMSNFIVVLRVGGWGRDEVILMGGGPHNNKTTVWEVAR